MLSAVTGVPPVSENEYIVPYNVMFVFDFIEYDFFCGNHCQRVVEFGGPHGKPDFINALLFDLA